MSGAGNDFVCLDNRSGKLRLTKRQRERLCHRQFGVGADGLLILEKSKASSKADVRMRYYNADGGEAEMCGNGARCFARYVQKMKSWKKARLSFDTPAGKITALFCGDEVQVDLTLPEWPPAEATVDASELPNPLYILNTGVPHAVVFVESIDDLDVISYGSLIRNHAKFAPAGTNVNFVEKRGKRLIVRTYERGVEAETLACGTGVTAVALVAHHVLELNSPIELVVRSGCKLKVFFEFDESGKKVSSVSLFGPADFVYQGEIHV